MSKEEPLIIKDFLSAERFQTPDPNWISASAWKVSEAGKWGIRFESSNTEIPSDNRIMFSCWAECHLPVAIDMFYLFGMTKKSLWMPWAVERRKIQTGVSSEVGSVKTSLTLAVRSYPTNPITIRSTFVNYLNIQADYEERLHVQILCDHRKSVDVVHYTISHWQYHHANFASKTMTSRWKVPRQTNLEASNKNIKQFILWIATKAVHIRWHLLWPQLRATELYCAELIFAESNNRIFRKKARILQVESCQFLHTDEKQIGAKKHYSSRTCVEGFRYRFRSNKKMLAAWW